MFWKGESGIFGRLIRMKTGCAYSHAELLFSDGSRFAIEAGIKARFYREEGVTLWKPDEWDVIEIGGGDEDLAHKHAVTLAGSDYDWRGIVFAQLLPWGWEHPTHYFCSEISTEILQAGKFMDASIKPYKLSPPKLAAHLLAHGGKFVVPLT